MVRKMQRLVFRSESITRLKVSDGRIAAVVAGIGFLSLLDSSLCPYYDCSYA